jgi:predicted dehydrogenase
MSTSTLRVGIIGVGGIANGKHMPTLAKMQDTAAMVAFCDVIEERATKGAEKFGVKGAKVFTDYREMLAGSALDVVHICTPNKQHSEITVAALEAGCHVMCEKPMAKTAVGARQMLAAAKRTGKKLTIGYDNRFRPDSQHLKKLCEAGRLGEIYYAKAHAIRRRAVPTWGVFLDGESQGGGPLIDIGTHALDLTLWMMNNYEPTCVMGSVFHKLSQRANEANAWESWDPAKFTVEDSAFGFIQFANGATVVLESSWALNTLDVREAKCTLCGTEGGADMDGGGLRLNGTELGRMYQQEVNLQAGGVAFYEGASLNRTDLEARTFYDAILNDTEPVVLPEQALVVSEILEAIYVSAQTGQPYYFERAAALV